jgi:hypothetical protein
MGKVCPGKIIFAEYSENITFVQNTRSVSITFIIVLCTLMQIIAFFLKSQFFYTDSGIFLKYDSVNFFNAAWTRRFL